MIRLTCPRSVRAAVVGSVLLPALVLAGCGSDEKAKSRADATVSADAPTEPPTADPATETPIVAPTATTPGVPVWALPVVTPGTKLTTVTAGDVRVEVYQVGVEKAAKTGQFVDPETNEPVIAVGDPVVFVNYVVKNTGSKPLALGYSLVEVEARYDNWKYIQGMDSVVDSVLYEKLGINADAIDSTKGTGKAPFILAPGESYSSGANFKYEKGQGITFEVHYVPVNATGDLLHDQRVEAEGKSRIS